MPPDKPIAPLPAFYCCYLLRAKNRKSYYIGSTPNPARRLGQHNGSSKGGAKRTSMQGKRPWDMTCIVTGFPSNFAALQFEWAWQNTHATRHIQRDVRDARVLELQKKKKTSPARRRARPPMSLEARLKNLHHLLGVRSFDRWPLHVRFFAPDVFALWERHTAKMTPPLRSSITVQLTPADPPAVVTDSTGDPPYQIPDIIRAIPVAYEDCKSHVEKVKALLDEKKARSCGVCRKRLSVSSALVLICPNKSCQTLCHLQCLSTRFLSEERNQDAFIPLRGTCPGCQTPLEWATLVKELSLRTRGQKEIEALFKPKRRRKADGKSESEVPETDAEEDSDLDETWIEDVNDVDASPVKPSKSLKLS